MYSNVTQRYETYILIENAAAWDADLYCMRRFLAWKRDVNLAQGVNIPEEVIHLPLAV
jgi:hypothetical protein